MKLKFKIECEMETEQMIEFYSILKTMEFFGNIGRSRTMNVFSDGDGIFRPKFKIEDIDDVENEDEIILAIEEETYKKTKQNNKEDKDYNYSLE